MERLFNSISAKLFHFSSLSLTTIHSKPSPHRASTFAKRLPLRAPFCQAFQLSLFTTILIHLCTLRLVEGSAALACDRSEMKSDCRQHKTQPLAKRSEKLWKCSLSAAQHARTSTLTQSLRSAGTNAATSQIFPPIFAEEKRNFWARGSRAPRKNNIYPRKIKSVLELRVLVSLLFAFAALSG